MELVIKVDRKQLINKVEDNYKRFKDTYEQLMVVFKAASETYQTEYAEYAKRIVQGKKAKMPIAPIKPANYSKNYKEYIEMFKADANEFVLLDEAKFRMLWLDNWNWTYSFGSSVGYYGTLAAGSCGLEGAAEVLNANSQYYSMDVT
jgi:hypothetical protein